VASPGTGGVEGGFGGVGVVGFWNVGPAGGGGGSLVWEELDMRHCRCWGDGQGYNGLGGREGLDRVDAKATLEYLTFIEARDMDSRV